MWPAPDPGNPRPEGGCLIGSPVLQQASGTAWNAADSRARVHALATGARFRPRLARDNRCQEHPPEFADLYFIVVCQYGRIHRVTVDVGAVETAGVDDSPAAVGVAAKF